MPQLINTMTAAFAEQKSAMRVQMFDHMQRLDPLYAPLTGLNLIEASAGSGKTHTLTTLYLRLVMEAGIPVHRILTVTYTNAATRELRERIRQRLAQTRLAFLRGRASDDDEFSTRMLDLLPDHELALRRLTNAVRGFDEAAIFTIHGFCQRVLNDSAFASGRAFQAELLADTSILLQQIVEDFWRRTLYPASPVIVRYVLEKRQSPEQWLKAIQPYLGKPYLKIQTPFADASRAQIEQDFNTAWDKAQRLWQADQAIIGRLLLESPALNRKSYAEKSLPGWLQEMDQCLNASTPTLELFDKFEWFTTAKLAKSTKKNQTTPSHPFFAACDALQAAAGRLIAYLHHQLPVDLLHYCNDELAKRKRRQQLQSYDDLLLDLHTALQHAQRGGPLAAALRQRYAAALVDEFQDTDPVQYAIFQQIYAGADQPVFLVGDPKQAIYSFRGADIFAYLTARQNARQRYTLDVNWRSDPRLISAVNALFSANRQRPFLFEAIGFQPAVPGPILREPLRIQGRIEAPLHIWQLEPDSDGDQSPSKTEALEQAAQATAAEIARLLNLGACGQARIGEQALSGGDIAVLVRSHRQGQQIRDHLLRLRVPSVQQTDASVFAAPEARLMEDLLAAVLEPGREGLMRTALASGWFGLSGERLYQLRDDEHAWADWLERFQNYRQHWRDQGFMHFFRAWLNEQGVAARLLTLRDGERRLTNLLHLAELLHTAGSIHPGMSSLLKWFSDHRRAPASKDEEQQIRLESDENLVRIVTIHKSKGLEYPVVFCPYLWDGKLKASQHDLLLYHDPAQASRPTLVAGADPHDPARNYVRDEELAENLRLCYVALTRAKQRCVLVLGQYQTRGKTDESGAAAPVWLLHQPPVVGPSQDPVEVTRDRFGQLTPAAIRAELHSALAAAGDSVTIAPLPRQAGQPYQPVDSTEAALRARDFSGPVAESWRVGSFTALTAQAASPTLVSETPDYDLEVMQPSEAAAPSPTEIYDSFSFPRGARAGICLHAIFERLDFANPDREQRAMLIHDQLQRHGLDSAAWTPAVSLWVEQALATPLDPSGLTLAAITPPQRLNELEFTYPAAALSAPALRALLNRHGAAGFGSEGEANLDFPPLHGYLKGFIDLVFRTGERFYLADYKSNWLGPEPADYQPPRLAEAMARETYGLQYLIYTVALHRYLRQRLPDYRYERHFGGVFYLFLRGMTPTAPDQGVFRTRPAPELVEALDRLLAGTPT